MSGAAKQRAWRFLRRGLVTLSCLVLVLVGFAVFLLSTQGGSVWLVQQLTGLLNQQPGLTVSIVKLEGTLFRGMTFSEVEITNDSGNFSIERLATQWNPYSLLSGNIYLSRLDVTGVVAELPPSQGSEQQGEFEIPWSANDLLPVPVEIAGIRISSVEVIQEATATFIDELRLSLRLNGKELSIGELSVSAFDTRLQGYIQITMAGTMPLAATISWRYEGDTALPYSDYAGEFSLKGDLQTAQIEHQLRLPEAITTSGSIVWGLFDDPFAFRLQHSLTSIELPIQSTESYVVNNSTITTAGNLDRVSIELAGELDLPAMPPLRVSASADYSENELDLELFNLSTSDSTATGTGSINWRNGITATGNLSVNSPSPLDYIDLEQPLDLSQLAIAANFSLEQLEDRFLGDLSINSLTGQMGSYPVQGSGAIVLQEDGIELRQIVLNSSSNRLSLDGAIADEISLAWSIEAPVLEEFLADLSGELHGSGTAHGEAATLDVDGELSGRDLRYGPLSIDEVNLNLAKVGENLNSAIRVGRLLYSDGTSSESFSDLQIDLSGAMNAHEIALSTESAYGEIGFTLQGSLESTEDLNWSGLFGSGTISTPIGTWTSRNFANLELRGNVATLGNSCWIQHESSICIEILPQQTGGYSVDAALQNYPLAVFNAPTSDDAGFADQTALFPQLPAGGRVEGHIEGDVAALLNPDQPMQVNFGIRSADASLIITPNISEDPAELEVEPEEQVYRIDRFELSGQARSGDVELGVVSSFIRESLEDSDLDLLGETSAQLSISADQRLVGSVTIDMDDIRWLEALLPDLSNISGAINSTVSIGGTTTDPELTGRVSVTEGSLTLESMGISLSGVSTEITSTNSTSAHFLGEATSGSGEISFEGTVSDPLDAARTISARIQGDNFQLANTPDLQIEVSPDVVVSADSQSFDVQGSLLLPTLALSLQRLPESSVDVSRDVVIVNYPADRPELARSDSAVNTLLFDIPISAQVNITLGEQVGFTGFGLETKLGGNLEVQQLASGGNLTYGELTVESGKYEMYGQTLEVRQGKLLFFGAYDNPAIDIRAIREVENQTVGVLMNGTLKSMRSQLFSTPALADNDIIAVIATGRPFSQVGAQDSDAMLGAIARLGLERGQGLTNQVRDKLGLDALAIENTGNLNNSVLTIGKYLTPEIFVRYGIGLFDSQPKVAIDYTLSERVKLKAESGEYQSVDITYTVEN